MIHLDIYGKPNSRYEHLKYMLFNKLNDYNIDVSFKEYNEVKKFIEQNVRSIPAIRLNDQTIFECKDGADINDFAENVVNEIVAREQQIQGSILVPLDFSKGSASAIRLAADLAKGRGLKVKLLHVYHPRPVEVGGSLWLDPNAVPKFCSQLEMVADQYRKEFADVEFAHEVIEGFAAEAIIDLSKEASNKYIIMNSNAQEDMIKKWLGSVSRSVAKEAACPMFVVPPSFDGKVENILIATADVREDVHGLKIVDRIGQALDAKTHVVHVSTPKAALTVPLGSPLDDSEFEELGGRFSWHEEVNEDIVEGILHVGQEVDADVIVLANRKRDFWDNLVHRSATQGVMNRLHDKAVLVIHL